MIFWAVFVMPHTILMICHRFWIFFKVFFWILKNLYHISRTSSCFLKLMKKFIVNTNYSKTKSLAPLLRIQVGQKFVSSRMLHLEILVLNAGIKKIRKWKVTFIFYFTLTQLSMNQMKMANSRYGANSIQSEIRWNFISRAKWKTWTYIKRTSTLYPWVA